LAKFFKTFLPLAFGLLIFWLIFHKLDFHEILSILKKDVNFWIIALSLPFGLFANIVRAYRWDLLIRPLGYKPKKSNLIYAVLGNYGVNLAVPRFGEIWRCSIITRYEKIPFPKLIGTMITDRLSDLFSVILIVIIAFILNIPYFNSFFQQYPVTFEKFHTLFSSGWLYYFIGISIAVVFLFFVEYGDLAWIKKLKTTVLNIWEGVHTVFLMKEKRKFFLYTLLIWVGYFLYFYICFYAFPFTKDLGWNCGLIAFGMSSIAVAVPVPGSIGPWHAAVIATLIGFGLSAIDAGAFAFCIHTIQALIFTALFGLFGVLALPVVNKNK
jgi:uncharacterized protein (TIRG00374 family)